MIPKAHEAGIGRLNALTAGCAGSGLSTGGGWIRDAGRLPPWVPRPGRR